MEGMEWVPWLLVALIPGIINTFVAYGELAERCKIFPFFEPYKIPGVWLWVLIQITFPAGLFWLIATLSDRPDIDSRLVLEAIVFGAGFTAVLNASITIRTRTYSIKPIYDRFIQIAYILIRNSEQGAKALEFWGDVEDALNTSPDFVDGLGYLEDYFTVEAAFVLPPDDYEARLSEVLAEPNKSQQAKLIKGLLQKVRRERLFNTLTRFHVNEAILRKYFPRRFPKTAASKR